MHWRSGRIRGIWEEVTWAALEMHGMRVTSGTRAMLGLLQLRLPLLPLRLGG